jgi:REP element-mobilizing transposase RayT
MLPQSLGGSAGSAGSAGASPYQASPYQTPPYPTRRKPAQGVHIDFNQPTIVFVTACTKDRARWLACDEAHRLLAEIWRRADAWLVGNYVLMPDHLHLFAAPRFDGWGSATLLRSLDRPYITIERWITFWKSQFSKSHRHADWVWQPSAFHHRLRRDENCSQKWLYVQENPVRAGLAKEIGQWPYQGTIHELRW